MPKMVFGGISYNFIRNDTEGLWFDNRNVLVHRVLSDNLTVLARNNGLKEDYNFSRIIPVSLEDNDTVERSQHHRKKVGGVKLINFVKNR